MNKFETISEKIRKEVIHSNNGHILSKKESDAKFTKTENRFLVPKNKMKIIISHCIYNEDQFFEGCLYDDLKINDLDAIHILDGAWQNFKGDYQSNDKTLEIIKDFTERAKKIDIQVIYEKHPKNKIWESESIKRNYQLDRIREIFGVDNVPYYNILKDGDEFFHHLSGRQNSWLKRFFIDGFNRSDNIGLINANAYYSDIGMYAPRLFPSNRKLHYYTGKSMVIHDENHNIVADYNPTIRNSGDPRICFKYQSIMIVNKFTIRNKQRQKDKIPFIKHIESQKGNIPCTFN